MTSATRQAARASPVSGGPARNSKDPVAHPPRQPTGIRSLRSVPGTTRVSSSLTGTDGAHPASSKMHSRPNKQDSVGDMSGALSSNGNGPAPAADGGHARGMSVSLCIIK